MKHCLGVILVCLCQWCLAQQLGDMAVSIDDDFLVWRTSESTNTLTGKQTTSSDIFKSSPDSIVWITNNGKSIYRLHINSKHQTWVDINEDGSQTYDVIWNNISGTIGFLRSNGDTKISTVFIKGNKNAAPFVFSVSEVIKN